MSSHDLTVTINSIVWAVVIIVVTGIIAWISHDYHKRM